MRAEPNFADGFDGQIALRLIFNGCKRAVEGDPCSGCHNPDLWDFDNNEEDYVVLEESLKYWTGHEMSFDCISIIGGEPLDQPYEDIDKALDIVGKYYKRLPIITYTGYELEEVENSGLIEHPAIQKASYVKFGPYLEGVEGKGKLASGNQIMTEVIRTSKGLRFITVEY